jgi:hypothetical protein
MNANTQNGSLAPNTSSKLLKTVMREMAAELPLRIDKWGSRSCFVRQGFCDLRAVFQEHISLKKKKEERLE